MKRKLSLLGFFLLIILLGSVFVYADTDIPDLVYKGHVYRVIGHRAKFDAAEAECKAMGGHLATITSAGENAAITNYIRQYYNASSYMIGLFDPAGSNGTWSCWVTGEPVTYKNWGAGQPDWTGQTVCIINGTANSYYRWEIGEWDNGWNGDYCFICEWDKAPDDISYASVTLSAKVVTYDGSAKKPTPTVTLNGKALASGKDYKVSYSNNTNAGIANVNLMGKGKYTGSKNVPFTINPASLSKASITLSKTAYTYNGKARTPSATVKIGKKTLSKNKDFTVSYNNNVNIGKATVTVTGKQNYTGSRNVNFTIVPAKVSSWSLTNTGKGEFTAVIDPVPQADQYEIVYSKSSKFTQKWTKRTAKNKYTVSAGNLGVKQKYYVKARALRTVAGSVYYGAWSSVKNITTKDASIKLDRESYTIVTPSSKTFQLKATVDGKSKKVTWKSSNKHVATVKDGKVTAVANSGITIISATANGVTAYCNVSIQNWKYVTKTIRFNSVKQWASAIKDVETSLFPYNPLVIDAVTGKNKSDVHMITGIQVLESKTVTESVTIAGEKKSFTVTCPSKIRYKLMCHIHDFVGNNSLKYYVGNGGIVLTQTCRCGYRSEWTWELPDPEGFQTGKQAVKDSYTVTARSKY